MRIACCFSAVLLTASYVQAAGRCEDLVKLAFPRVVINKAESQAAGTLNGGGPGAPRVQLPAACVVQGMIAKRTGVDGKSYGIGFEVRLPENWQGRFLFQGGGGTDGVIQPAIGAVAGTTALARGFAVVSTDAGHQGRDASFGHDQQARLDYAYNALGEVTAIAKQIVTAYYGRPAGHSYFMGCSNGGRQGMMLSQRFPQEYDGIVAGDPGFRLSYAAIAEAWDSMAFAAIAPKDDQGRPILSEAFSNSDLTLLANAVLKECDDKDGLKDGLIDNPEACHFDPTVLVCSGAKNDSCLSRPQVDALHKIFGGAVDSKGNRLYSGWPYDGGIGAPGWRVWKLGTSRTASPNAINATLGFGALRDYFVTPYDPQFNPLQFDFDRDPARVAPTAVFNDAVSTQLSTFSGHGGKLLIYHGLSDPVFSASDTEAYYRALAADNGGMDATRGWARLFLVPGMNHCGGGPALDQFDALSPMVDWVENGVAPDRMAATGASFPGRSRPLCPYPQQAHYSGSGSTEQASSFSCR